MKLTKENIFKKLKDPWILVLLFMALLFGYFIRGEGSVSHRHETQMNLEQKQGVWTCSMHPQVQLPKPGDCPICGMDLIPVEVDSGDNLGPRELSLSESAQKLAQIETTLVERKFVEAQIRMVGKVDYDETNLGYITAYVGGRLDRLYVDYTGVMVNKGDHMASLYSPELLTAQEELIQSLKAVKGLKESDINILKETALSTVESAREKLRLWGLTAEQIEGIERRGISVDHITIYSPMAGIVIHKNALEGMYVQTGTRIYTLADLSKVWVKLDAYESDLSWLRYGQEVEFYTEAYPGKIFKGKIAFIDPVLSEKTRTVKIRVNVENLDFQLKPGMFVRALVRAKVSKGGYVMDPALAGRWICPMHPEIIEKEAGSCLICEMPLVQAEQLGYVSADTEGEAPIVIPVSAPLITGTRAVVYVKVPGTLSNYEGREVVLGPRAGDYFLVESGLSEGEEVVTRGNFKIDSALQIQAKPSMMNEEQHRHH